MTVGLSLRHARRSRTPDRSVEADGLVMPLAFTLASAATAAAIFGLLDGLPLGFVLVGVTMCFALRFSTAAVAVHALVLSVVAVGFTLAGHGPFAAIADNSVRAIVVQAYVGLNVLVGMTLALGRDERDALVASLQVQVAELASARAAAEAAQRDTQAREELNDAVLESVGTGIVVADGQGRLTRFNQTARDWHGVDADASLNPDEFAASYDLFGPDGTTPLTTDDIPLLRTLREGAVRDVEFVIAREGHEARHLVCNGRTMWSPDGTLLGAVVSMNDVTPERKREADLVQAKQSLQRQRGELQRSNSELAHFATVVSHDLNSPLAMIIGYLTLVEREIVRSGDTAVLPLVDKASKGATRMRDLINSLLSYSRAGGGALRSEYVDLERALDDSLMDLRRELDEAGAQIDRIALPVVVGDGVLLRQLFQNLISNAVKYRQSDRPCRVIISVDECPDSYAITVADNGRGVPIEERERVFAMFSQVLTSDAEIGHGIGLATCQRIVERHGGSIHMSESSLGGVAVTFRLPRVDVDRLADTRHETTVSA